MPAHFESQIARPLETALETRQLLTLQAMRAVAVVAVVHLHTLTTPNVGHFGVDLFFTISGFVMAMIVQKGESPLNFATHRFTRIVPLYWIMTSVVMVFVSFNPSVFKTTTASWPRYIMSLLFIPHMREGGSMYPMLVQGWTLNYEMAFYAVLWLSLLLRKPVIPAATCGLTLLFAVGYLAPKGTAAREFLFSSLWFEFIIGMLIFRLRTNRQLPVLPWWFGGALIVGLILLMAHVEGTADRFLSAGIPGALIIAVAVGMESHFQKPSLPMRVAAELGNASYSTYLTHLFTIGLIERIIFMNLGITEKSWITAIFTSFVCLIVGEATHHLLDNPVRRILRRGNFLAATG